MGKIKNVILDYGHGGIDSKGNYTTAPSKMFKFPDGQIAYEGELNREIGGILYWMMKNSIKGVNIHETVKANDPRDISLPQRVRKINSFPASNTIVISIHCNASRNHNAQGFEIFSTRRKNNSDKLAEAIAYQVEDRLQGKTKMRFDYSDGDRDKEADHYITRKANCPAVLVECGFFDYKPEFIKLSNPSYQKNLAYAIYKGIRHYVQNS